MSVTPRDMEPSPYRTEAAHLRQIEALQDSLTFAAERIQFLEARLRLLEESRVVLERQAKAA